MPTIIIPAWVKTFLVYIIILFTGFGFGYLYCQKSTELHQIKTLTAQVTKTKNDQSAVDAIPLAADAKAIVADKKIQTKYVTLTKEVYIYVKTNKDAGSPIGAAWVSLHDDATANPSQSTTTSSESSQPTASAPQ